MTGKALCKSGVMVQRTTKTESGKRTIPLNGKAMEPLGLMLTVGQHWILAFH